jgi:DNA-binding NtrC family response regulator
MRTRRILVIDGDESLRRLVQAQIEDEGYIPTAAASMEEALGVLAHQPQDLVILGLGTAERCGIDVWERLRLEQPDTVVIPVGSADPELLRLRIGKGLQHAALREELQALRDVTDLRQCSESVDRRSDARAVVLVQGISWASVERDLILQTLRRCHGDQGQAARRLGLSRDALIDRMEEHGLTPSAIPA